MHKIKLLLVLMVFWFDPTLRAQTFNSDPANVGTIPDGTGVAKCFPLSVSGVGIISGNYGLAKVCINISHNWVSDLEISLKAPDGTTVPLSIQNGGSGDNYTNTCFSGTANSSIGNGKAPFTGEYTPDGAMSLVNNGQNADGNWALCIKDIFFDFEGTLNSWSITFNASPAPPPPPIPVCIGNPPAGNNCSVASPVCNFNGYCGNTSDTYTSDKWPQLSAAFCALSIDNNSFVTFVASEPTAVFNIWVSNSKTGEGLQMMFYSGDCGSGSVTSKGCYQQIKPSVYPIVVSAADLIPDNTYYLMFDGFAGDVCDYTISAVSGVNILDVKTSVKSVCKGKPIQLSASGSKGSYTWSGPNLLSNTGAEVTALPTVNSTYTVTLDAPIGDCSISKDISILVDPSPNLGPDQSDTLCIGDSIDCTKKFATNGLSTVWTKDGFPIDHPNNIKDTGYYQIEGTNVLGCADTAQIHIVIQPPIVAFAGNDTIAAKNKPHQLFATGGKTYLWSPSFPLDNPTAQNPQATLKNDQRFIVTAFSSKGCFAKDTVFIQVYDGPAYYTPKAFTPNGDGLNDIFRPIPAGIASTETFKIFNRQGVMVFSTNQWLKGWDGTYMGRNQTQGTYVWILRGTDKYGNRIETKGTVLLIR